jgi:hypothetical protein
LQFDAIGGKINDKHRKVDEKPVAKLMQAFAKPMKPGKI